MINNNNPSSDNFINIYTLNNCIDKILKTNNNNEINTKFKKEIILNINSYLNKDFICDICTQKNDIICITNCYHLYCNNCIKMFTKNSSNCPICRKIINLDKIIYTSKHVKKNLKILTNSNTNIDYENNILSLINQYNEERIENIKSRLIILCGKLSLHHNNLTTGNIIDEIINITEV